MLKKIVYFALLLVTNIGIGRIWQVPEQIGQLYPHIQNEIEYWEVVNFDTLSVRQGTVENPEIYNENIIFRSKDITVINRDFLPGGSNNPATCIIDGSERTRTSDSGSVVTFKDEETRDAVVKGFTVQKEKIISYE